MADTTPKKRSGIINLAELTKYTQRNVAGVVGVSQKSVSWIIKQQAETGSFTPNKRERVKKTENDLKKRCFSHQKQ